MFLKKLNTQTLATVCKNNSEEIQSKTANHSLAGQHDVNVKYQPHIKDLGPVSI